MKRYKISQLKMEIDCDESLLRVKAAKKLRINVSDIKDFIIMKKSIDARKKPEIYYVYTVVVTAENVKGSMLKNKDVSDVGDEVTYRFDCLGGNDSGLRPVVVGFGPAGMFCAYMLAKNGYRPIVIERGERIEKRKEIVERFWNTGILDVETNVQFGEGGAGTFSDGKLNTGVNDKMGRNRFVLETFVKFGAKENILYDAKPHVGTDVLYYVVKNIREEIIKCGGTVRFNSKLTDIQFEGDKVKSITINDTENIETDIVVLALGHSARDTFEMLDFLNVKMEQKPFAIGVRMEHSQKMINEAMYGENYDNKLPAAPYKLTAKAENGRGVYSFCMCPGGYVVDASSEKGRIAVNGMSYNAREGDNANSAIVTTITPDDFPDDTPLAGVKFQRELEEKAFAEGGGHIPVQLYGDFVKNVKSSEIGKVSPNIKGKFTLSNIKNILPGQVCEAIEECMPKFSKVIDGFDNPDTVLSAIESRTSSPVRITRNERFESVSHGGIYPCGEGAGYAGGIMSAAMDGIKVFEAIAKRRLESEI